MGTSSRLNHLFFNGLLGMCAHLQAEMKTQPLRLAKNGGRANDERDDNGKTWNSGFGHSPFFKYFIRYRWGCPRHYRLLCR